MHLPRPPETLEVGNDTHSFSFTFTYRNDPGQLRLIAHGHGNDDIVQLITGDHFIYISSFTEILSVEGGIPHVVDKTGQRIAILIAFYILLVKIDAAFVGAHDKHSPVELPVTPELFHHHPDDQFLSRQQGEKQHTVEKQVGPAKGNAFKQEEYNERPEQRVQAESFEKFDKLDRKRNTAVVFIQAYKAGRYEPTGQRGNNNEDTGIIRHAHRADLLHNSKNQQDRSQVGQNFHLDGRTIGSLHATRLLVSEQDWTRQRCVELSTIRQQQRRFRCRKYNY